MISGRSIGVLVAVAVSLPALYFWEFPFTKMNIHLSFKRAFKLLLKRKDTKPTLPPSLAAWQYPDEVDSMFGKFLECKKIWVSLAPFFLSKGYTLYEEDLEEPRKSETFPPHPFKEDLETEYDYPFAKRTYKHDKDSYFSATAVRVWAARDSKGRDVVIKVVADDTPSIELELLMFLNSKEARSDPRNHIITLLDILRYDKYTFVVTPRWGQAFWPDMGTVDEVMHLNKAFLEVPDFLHENRIEYADFHENNTVMDVIYPPRNSYMKNLRSTSTRYALIDFGFSRKYPSHLTLEEILVPPEELSSANTPPPKAPSSPFAVDVYSFGRTLERWSRHIENVVPELGPFYGDMTNPDHSRRPNAREALLRFMAIYQGLSEAQLSHEVLHRFWKNRKLISKDTTISDYRRKAL